MSRRKQAKPQHLSSDEDSLQTDVVSENALLEAMDEEEGSGRQSRHGSKETRVCEKCCAEFFSWAELCEHQRGCTEDPLVLIVKEDEGIPRPELSPVGPSPAPSFTPSDPADMESTDGGFELVETVNDNDSLDVLEEREDESMELEQQPQDKHKHQASSLQPPGSIESISPEMSTVASYSMPTTNVTLEILQSTRVAVAQFSQSIHNGRVVGGKAATAAIPVILEHLLALQQQQVHQLQLIEQIRSQVAVMNKQPTQTALNPVSRALALAPIPFPSQSLITTPVLPLSGTMPSAINGQASVSLASVLERSQMLTSQTVCSQSNLRDVSSTSASSEAPAAPPSSCSNISTTLPSYVGTHSSVSSTQALSSSSPRSLGQSNLLSSSSLPFLPQSPPSSVIFPNPLASIAATANALDPLAALMKHRKGKLPNVSVFDTKPSPEEPFFKHKCRFCAKVFGSDSALQIHLRSHTGERPFKCNICGNRFSTKGNLKVHFQRHKEKYPHVQMNPYPVPEYLDNVPTSSGIPYGMSFPPEKPGSTWLDSKPVLASMPTSMGLQLASTLSSVGNSNDFVSVTPSIKSPYRPASSECASLSPKSTNTEPNVPLASESPQPKPEVEFYNVTKAEEVHLPQNCTTRPRESPVIAATSTALTTTATTPLPSAPASPMSEASPLSLTSDQFKARFPFGGPLDSMQTSETSKLQQLVENIDKKITDPNQCVLCHRVLSCQSALKMHYRIHTGERPFKCKVCGRAFTTKGNLKTHFGVHRANPPLRVQHSCPICQKRFTNAVVLQQHIRMHMGGHIPDSPVMEGLQETDSANPTFDENNFDSPSSLENDFMDDNSMEDDDEEEDEEAENMEESADPFQPLSLLASSPPKSSAVVSSIAALENQMKMMDSTVSLKHCFGIKSLMNGFTDSDRFTFNSTSSTAGNSEDYKAGSPTASESSRSMPVPTSPAQSSTEGHHLSRSPDVNHRAEFQDIATSVKNERADSPTQDLRGTQPNKPSVKEENPYSMMFLSRECGPHQSMPSLVSSTVPSPVKTELNGYSRQTIPNQGHQHPPYSLQVPAAYTSVGSPGLTSLLAPAPPRRTPKQHNCNACGKNFSSASALQIHERTHTGEKPFGCSICGRAFTTKGNLKVHMGTHMWNNAPARRGRRLSVENPMALLGGEAMKFGEMFQKDLAARAMNVDAGFWNRYAAAITNGLAMKNNEISVIQNGGITQLHAMTAGMERVNAGGSPPMTSLGKTGMDLGVNRHFSMLIDDSKEIGIN